MVNRLILHIGPPKTGSKSIQTGFHSHREVLKSSGVFYPSGSWHGQLASWAQNGNIRSTYNTWAKRRDPEEIRSSDDAYVTNLLQEIAASQCETALLSYEGFSVLAREEFQKLKECLDTVCGRIEILLYIRHPVTWVKSEMSTRALHGLPATNPQNFTRKYSSILNRVFDVFGRNAVIAREFDSNLLYRADPFLDALSVCDAKLAESFPSTDEEKMPVNTALSLEAIQIAAHLRDELSMSANRRLKRKYEQFLQNLNGDKFLLSKRELSLVHEVVSSEIRFLKRELGFEFSRPPSVEFRHHKAGLSKEQSQAIARTLKILLEDT